MQLGILSKYKAREVKRVANNNIFELEIKSKLNLSGIITTKSATKYLIDLYRRGQNLAQKAIIRIINNKQFLYLYENPTQCITTVNILKKTQIIRDENRNDESNQEG